MWQLTSPAAARAARTAAALCWPPTGKILARAALSLPRAAAARARLPPLLALALSRRRMSHHSHAAPPPAALGALAHEKGSIHLIIGPMFSGKSTELLRRMRRFSMAQRRCMLIKYSKDTRYSLEGVVTHDRQSSSAMACTVLEEVREKAHTYDVLGIDEGQFFPDIVSFCEDMANAGKMVIVAALDGTYQRKPFGNILELVPLSEGVVKLNAVCMSCHQEAAFSKRISNETAVELIGGQDKYIAVCRECFYSPSAPKASGTDSGVSSPLSTPEQAQNPSPSKAAQSSPIPFDVNGVCDEDK